VDINDQTRLALFVNKAGGFSIRGNKKCLFHIFWSEEQIMALEIIYLLKH